MFKSRMIIIQNKYFVSNRGRKIIQNTGKVFKNASVLIKVIIKVRNDNMNSTFYSNSTFTA